MNNYRSMADMIEEIKEKDREIKRLNDMIHFLRCRTISAEDFAPTQSSLYGDMSALRARVDQLEMVTGIASRATGTAAEEAGSRHGATSAPKPE